MVWRTFYKAYSLPGSARTLPLGISRAARRMCLAIGFMQTKQMAQRDRGCVNFG